MSQEQTWPGPVAFRTGFSRGGRLFSLLAETVGRSSWSSSCAAMRHHVRRDASITPSSHAVANELSTET